MNKKLMLPITPITPITSITQISTGYMLMQRTILLLILFLVAGWLLARLAKKHHRKAWPYFILGFVIPIIGIRIGIFISYIPIHTGDRTETYLSFGDPLSLLLYLGLYFYLQHRWSKRGKDHTDTDTNTNPNTKPNPGEGE